LYVHLSTPFISSNEISPLYITLGPESGQKTPEIEVENTDWLLNGKVLAIGTGHFGSIY